MEHSLSAGPIGSPVNRCAEKVYKQPQCVAPALLNLTLVPVVKTQRAHGFSLLEIVVVVGIIGVISALALPIFDNAIAGFRVSGDARSLSNSAALAKMRAASDFSRVRLHVDLSARTNDEPVDGRLLRLRRCDGTASKYARDHRPSAVVHG
jgi:prepilin-type N-terminal cleavage/methylation domain-containing protein